MAFKISIYAYVLGFTLLPSNYIIAVLEMCRGFFPRKQKNPAIHTEKLTAQKKIMSEMF